MGGSSVIKAFHYFVGFGAEKAASKLQETVLPSPFLSGPAGNCYGLFSASCLFFSGRQVFPSPPLFATAFNRRHIFMPIRFYCKVLWYFSPNRTGCAFIAFLLFIIQECHQALPFFYLACIFHVFFSSAELVRLFFVVVPAEHQARGNEFSGSWCPITKSVGKVKSVVA